jgi:hypothetical protein
MTAKPLRELGQEIEIKSDNKNVFKTSFTQESHETSKNVVNESKNGIPRRFSVNEKDITISCVVSTFSNPSSTRLVPPMSWLTSSGSRVKILYSIKNMNTDFADDVIEALNSPNYVAKPVNVLKSSILEISVNRKQVDESLRFLRMNGFRKQDLYRMLDKGPWILAFDLSNPLSKLLFDLQVFLLQFESID